MSDNFMSKKPETKTDAELARELNVNVRTIGRWRKAGYPLHDLEALKKKVAGQRTAPESIEPKTVTEAKLKKLLIDIEAAQLKLGVARGEFVTKAKHDEVLTRVGLRTRSACQRIVEEAPHWAGLQPEELSRRGKAIFNAICAELSDPRSY